MLQVIEVSDTVSTNNIALNIFTNVLTIVGRALATYNWEQYRNEAISIFSTGD